MEGLYICFNCGRRTMTVALIGVEAHIEYYCRRCEHIAVADLGDPRSKPVQVYRRSRRAKPAAPTTITSVATDDEWLQANCGLTAEEVALAHENAHFWNYDGRCGGGRQVSRKFCLTEDMHEFYTGWGFSVWINPKYRAEQGC